MCISRHTALLTYSSDFPTVSLALSGKTGNTTLSAVVLTKNGVIINVSKNISVYTPADGASFHDGSNPLTAITMTANENRTVYANVIYDPNSHSQAEVGLGNVTLSSGTAQGYDQILVAFGEAAHKFTWASENTSVATVTSGTNGSCIITAKAPGTAFITVSIETEKGNIYTARLEVTVSAP